MALRPLDRPGRRRRFSSPGAEGRGGEPARRGTVVCAIAGPDQAERPLLVAAHLAEGLDDELVLVHAASPPPPPPRAGGLTREPLSPAARAALEQSADDVLHRCARHCGIASARRRPVVGEPVAAVVGVADEVRAELIVVGSRRRGLLASAVLGSVSREIADAAERPVVVVPTTGTLRPPTPFGRIVCGVGAHPQARVAVRVAHDLAERLGVGLVLVSVSRTPAPRGVSPVPGAPSGVAHGAPADRVSLLERLAAEEGLPAGTELRALYGAPAEVLESVAADEDAGLIVVGRRGGLVRDALRGSVSAALQSHAERPVVLA